MDILILRVLCINTSQTAASWSKARSIEMEIFTSLLSGLVPEMLQSLELLLQMFLGSSVSFDLFLSGFLLPSIFSSSLCSKHRAENAEINHFEVSLCG